MTRAPIISTDKKSSNLIFKRTRNKEFPSKQFAPLLFSRALKVIIFFFSIKLKFCVKIIFRWAIPKSKPTTISFFFEFFFRQNQYKARFKVRTGEDAPFAGIEIRRLFRPKQSSEPKPKTSVNEKNCTKFAFGCFVGTWLGWVITELEGKWARRP